MKKRSRPVRSRVEVCLTLFLLSAVHLSFAERNARAIPPNGLRFPLSFEQNRGQTKPDVRFLARAGRYRLYLTKNTSVLDLAGDKSRGTNALVRTTFQHSNPATKVSGLEPQATTTSYLLGAKEEWKTGVAHYNKVRYRSVTQNVYNRTWWEERVEAVSMAAAMVWREFLAQPVPTTRM